MKPLKASEKLDKRQKNYLKKKFGISAYKDLSTAVLKKLKEAMKQLTDTRINEKSTYKIWDVVVCIIVSVLCGKKDWEEIHDFVEEKYDFFRSFLKMTGGIPCSKTYKRIMAIIDYKELEKILVTFFQSITQDLMQEIDIINMDGRESRGSKRKETIKREEVSPLNMLNAYSNKYGICLCSQMIDEKTNEIPNIETIIEGLNITGSIITWDALNTQKSNVASVRKKGGSYVVPIKGNHSLFFEELQEFWNEKEIEFIKAGQRNTGYKEVNEYKNGQAIKYEYFQTLEVDWFEEKELWKDLKSFVLVKKTIENKDKITTEYRYYISDLDINIELIKEAIRKHWSVENKLHWHLDVTFRQDKNTTIDKNALANLEIVNKFNLGMLSKVQKYYGISLKRIMGKLSLNIEENLVEFISLLTLAYGDCK